MGKIWVLYGYYRFYRAMVVIKAWNYEPPDQDQNEVKRAAGFDGYELREMEVTTT